MKLNDLQDLLIEQLLDLFDAEKQLDILLPRMSRASYSPDLRKTFDAHLRITSKQIERLGEVFKKLRVSPDSHICEGMKGLVRESKKAMEFEANPIIKDTALISAAQRIEHYEMAGYRTVRTFARELGYDEIADLLQESLDEESDADKQLTSLAKGGFFSSK